MYYFTYFSFKEGKISNCPSAVYKYPDPVIRNTYIMALNGKLLFYSCFFFFLIIKL